MAKAADAIRVRRSRRTDGDVPDYGEVSGSDEEGEDGARIPKPSSPAARAARVAGAASAPLIGAWGAGAAGRSKGKARGRGKDKGKEQGGAGAGEAEEDGDEGGGGDAAMKEEERLAREREGRWNHLLKPTRDLAANWKFDVAGDLDEFLEELEEVEYDFEGGERELNFAEAALLLQGSAGIYSKKVEYLYQMVSKSLEAMGEMRGEARMGREDVPEGGVGQGEGDHGKTPAKARGRAKSSINELGEDLDVFMEEPERFLELDDFVAKHVAAKRSDIDLIEKLDDVDLGFDDDLDEGPDEEGGKSSAASASAPRSTPKTPRFRADLALSELGPLKHMSAGSLFELPRGIEEAACLEPGVGIDQQQKMLAFRCCSSMLHESGALLIQPELLDLATEEFGNKKTPGRLRGFKEMVNNGVGPDGLPRRTPVAQRVMDDLRKQMDYRTSDALEGEEEEMRRLDAELDIGEEALGAYDEVDEDEGYGGGGDDEGYARAEEVPAESGDPMQSPGPAAREVQVVKVKQKRKGGRRVRFAEDSPDPWAELDIHDDTGAGSGVEGGKPMRRARTWRKEKSFAGTSLDDAASMLWEEEFAREGGTGVEIRRPPVPGDRGAGVLGAPAFPEFAYMYDAMRRRKRVAAMASARAASSRDNGVEVEHDTVIAGVTSPKAAQEEEDVEEMERLRAAPVAGTSFEDDQFGGYGGDEDAWGGGGHEGDVELAEADNDDELPPVTLDFDALAEAYKDDAESTRMARQDGMTYEQLVKLHVEKYVASCVLKASGVQLRVSEWREKVTPAIKVQEERDPFDLNGVSDKLLTQLKDCPDERDDAGAGKMDVAHLLQSDAGQFDVCRKFVSMLQLINSENISLQVRDAEIARDEDASPPILGEGAARVSLLREKREGPDIEKIVFQSAKQRKKDEREAELRALEEANEIAIREDAPPPKQAGRGRSRLSQPVSIEN